MFREKKTIENTEKIALFLRARDNEIAALIQFYKQKLSQCSSMGYSLRKLI